MAREIQIGDKVKCIKPNESNILILHEIYTVTDIDSDSFWLTEHPMYWFYKYRFELVEDCELIETF